MSAVELGQAWRRFLDAVESGDHDAIGACVAPDVTMYVPFNNTRDGLQGRAAVVALFARVFAAYRGQRGPRIAVERFDCRELAPGTWLAESMLRFGNEWGRRTLVYARDGEGEWRLLHMHASNLVAAQSRLPFALG